MADENALALQIRANTPDIGAPLNQAAQIGYLGEHARQLGISNDYAQMLNNIRIQAAQEGASGDASQDPDGSPGGGGMLGSNYLKKMLVLDPANASKTVTGLKTMQETAQAKAANAKQVLGQAAQAFLQINAKDPVAGKAFWNDTIGQAARDGSISWLKYQQLHDAPDPKLAQALVAQSMAPKDYAETSGAAAGNQAAAKYPYEQGLEGERGRQARLTERSKLLAVGPEQDIVDPTQSGAAPPIPARPVGPGGTLSTTVPAAPAANLPATPPAAGAGAANAGGAGAGGTAPQGAPAGAGGAAAPGKLDVPYSPMSATAGPAKPGVIRQGQDPNILQVKKDATERYSKEIVPAANAGQEAQGELGTMRTLLQQGLMTNASAPARAVASAWLNSVFGHDIAKSFTGIDPAQADVFNKDATRLGFALSRTLGAREAMQVVQAAIKANPNLANTTEGNRMVIELLNQQSQYAIDKLKYADAWQAKNGDLGHFDAWFAQEHPIASYLSHAMPYELPRGDDGKITRDQLQKGVIYNTKKGRGLFDGTGFTATP